MKRNKKLLALLLTLALSTSMLAACGSSSTSSTPDTSTPASETPATTTSESRVINVYAFGPEIPDALARYKELNPSFDWELKVTIINDDTAYPGALEQALLQGGDAAPDLYVVESAYVLRFTQGDFASYAAAYADLIPDFESKKAAAQVAQYAVDIGTRNGTVVGMRYQETGACLIYRRSIAEDVWGTDDPTTIASKMGPGWDNFLKGAADLKAKGYYTVYGLGDIWKVVKDSAAQGWIVGDKLVLDPAREYAFDLAKEMNDNGYWAGGGQWSEGWSASMGGDEVFAFLGPAWLINYVMVDNVGDTFGDWAVTTSPLPWTWGGTWLVGNKNLTGDKAAAVGQLIEWVTLDTSETGFQYYFASGNLYEGSADFPDKAKDFADTGGTKDTVASKVVMEKADGSVAILGGQNMFDYFIPAGANAKADNWTQYDGTIEGMFIDQITQYYEGNKSKEDAIASFKAQVADELGYSE
jgi:hypothetical protein